jgi:Fe2+ or Zn2+ uptake regulation protein
MGLCVELPPQDRDQVKVFECAGKRYRMTPQSKAVLDLVRHANSRPDAAWVFQQVGNVIPNIGLSTVHRTLSLVREAGFISKTEASEPTVRDADKTQPHCHVRSVDCSHIVDIETNSGAHQVQPASPTNFAIARLHLDSYGLCADCPQDRERKQR